MKKPPVHRRGHWLVAGSAALAVAVAAALLFRVPASPIPPPAVPASAPVELRNISRGTTLQSEEAALRDLAPLFLPTPRNATLERLPQREPGRSMIDQEVPRLGFGEGGAALEQDLPPVVTLNGRTLAAAGPLDALLGISPGPALSGIGRMAVELPQLAPRGAVIDVVAAGTGKSVLTDELPSAAKPQTDQMWQPLVLFAAVDAAGLVAPLAVVGVSGVDVVDGHFRSYLARSYRIGDRLTPGFYRITIAP